MGASSRVVESGFVAEARDSGIAVVTAATAEAEDSGRSTPGAVGSTFFLTVTSVARSSFVGINEKMSDCVDMELYVKVLGALQPFARQERMAERVH